MLTCHSWRRFLLARLQLESAMRSATSARTLFNLLEKMPSGVNDMYDLTMERINSQPGELASIAHRLFVWLLFYKPRWNQVSVTMIQEALAVSVENRAYDKLDITPVDLILSACHGLVTITEDDPVLFRFIRG